MHSLMNIDWCCPVGAKLGLDESAGHWGDRGPLHSSRWEHVPCVHHYLYVIQCETEDHET